MFYVCTAVGDIAAGVIERATLNARRHYRRLQNKRPLWKRVFRDHLPAWPRRPCAQHEPHDEHVVTWYADSDACKINTRPRSVLGPASPKIKIEGHARMVLFKCCAPIHSQLKRLQMILGGKGAYELQHIFSKQVFYIANRYDNL